MKSAKEVSEFAEDIIDTVREPLVVLDKDLRVVIANRSFYDFFKVIQRETIGTLIYDLGNNQWNIPKLRELLETILPEKTSFDNYEVEHVFPRIGRCIMLLNARKIQRGSGKEQIILLAIEDITERKLAEEALSISEIRYRGLFESAKDGILILDSETGRIVDVNPILVYMLGYSREHFINKTIWEIGVFKNIVANQEKYLEFQKKGYTRFEHLPLETKDGRRIDIEFVSHVNIAHQQKVTQCNIRDITKHKQIEELLRESEEKYRILAELSPEMIYLIDLNGYITYLNKAGGAQFRVNPAEIIGKHITDVFPPDIANRNLTAIQKVIKTNTPSYNESEITFPFGNIWMSTRLSPVCDNEYRVISVLGLSIDITERKSLEESIKKQKDDFETIFNLVPAQIWYKDTHNKFIRVNKQACSDLGIPKDKIEGHSAGELFPSFANQYFQDDLEVINARIPKLGIIEEVNTAGGEIRWVNSDKIPVFGSDGEVSGLIAVVQDITERKKSQEALRISETRLRTLVQTIPDLIWLKDVNGVYLSCNKMFERFFGAKEAEIVGKTDFDFIDQKLADFFLEHDRKAMSAGKSTTNEEWITFADDGHRAYLETIKTPMYDSQGAIIGILGIGRDITERKIAEKEQKKQQSLLIISQRLSHIGSWETELSTGKLLWSDEMYNIMGFPKAPAVYTEMVLSVFPDDEKVRFRDAMASAVNGDSPYNIDYTIILPDGQNRIIHSEGEVVFDIHKKAIRMFGTTQDITGQKQIEEKLQESERRYKELTTLLPQSVFESDINGVITFANDFITETFGYSKDEVINKLTLQEMLVPEEIEKLNINITRLFNGEKNVDREYTLLKKNHNTFPALVYSNPIIREGLPVGLRGVLLDLSEIKKTERELINAKEKAESANKLKDAFIANISHEIRTPLNGILGMSSLIKDIFPGKISKENEELFDGIDYSSQRLIRTVDMILNYSRLQVGEFPLFPKNLELSAVCVKLVTEFTIAARKKLLDISFQNNYGDAVLFVDQYSINIAISNLIDNAIKYTKNGSINIILYSGKNDEIMLDIKDTGIGINEASLQNIFEPYRQEHMGYGRAYEGIGLGLSLVKKVLILNKVQLSTSSIKGKGTTFTMNFGKSALSENIPKTIISPDLAPDAKKLSNGVVLLVEDDFINQSTIKRFLENRYTLLITDSSDGALEILKKNKINLILMDISIMGNKNGLELTKELKASKEYCNIPVIAITAHAFEKDKLNALDAGCDNYLAKPFSKESLLGMIAVYKI